MSYGRRLELRVGDKLIKYNELGGLRVAFDVSRDKSRDPNSAKISIWNLAETTSRAWESEERVFVELRAGYADEAVHTLFLGVALDIRTERDGASMVTNLELGDDDKQKAALQRIHRTFSKGTPVATVLRELVKATRLKGDNLDQVAGFARIGDSTTLTRSHLATGSALGELQHFTRALGLSWTVQDQSIVFGSVDKGTAGSGPRLKSENLAAKPAIDGKGNISLTTRLIPDLLPGRPFDVEGFGLFVATQTQHQGDTHGNDWSVIVEGEPFETSVKRGLVVNGKAA